MDSLTIGLVVQFPSVEMSLSKMLNSELLLLCIIVGLHVKKLLQTDFLLVYMSRYNTWK